MKKLIAIVLAVVMVLGLAARRNQGYRGSQADRRH